MRRIFMLLAAALVALPIFAEQKKPTVTPTSAANRSINLNSSKSNRVAQPTVTPTPESDATRGKPTKDQRQMTGKVIRVLSQQGRATFVVQSKGKEFTFSAANLKALPKVGDVIDITYTQTPSGPLEATTVKSSKSNTSD